MLNKTQKSSLLKKPERSRTMRKHQQKQIFQLLKTIEEAQSAGMYADCQEGAISIGNFIENIESEATQTVALLEEYCGLLFKASNGEIREKLLRRHLIKIENSVKDELKPNKIEVVFFPYKVSMWDSLESIYLAAKADPNCDAYVVPIPSYELNPNGTLGKMYYDGDQYPEDIPVADWQTYDIEARHPDAVFIHYAYDDNVNNATIHPDFYSKHLREHCDLLLYVPYFVMSGDTVDEYCGYLPGVLHAHHVIVQSEAARQSYIGHYKKFDKEFGLKGRFGKAEKKFIALGSPKFDKVMNTRREDCELPVEWERLIYNPDGSRKKVILYNTHMFAWINGGAAYFKKLYSVFDFFRSRDDVVLWWRPHPNTEMNFRIKRPEWLDEYMRVLSNYRCGKRGIYDNSPDLHRAIAMSDIYYGDGSSIVSLFQTARKPSLTQDVNILDYDKRVVSHAMYYDGEYIWSAALNFNALFRISPATYKIEYIGQFSNEKQEGYELFCGVAEYGAKLYFCPYNAKNIAVYDKMTSEFTTIPLNEDIRGIDRKFTSILVCGKYVYLQGSRVFTIARIDTETNEIMYIDNWVKDLAKRKCEKVPYYIQRGCVYGGLIYYFSSTSRCLLSIKPDDLSYELIPLRYTDSDGFSQLLHDGDKLWLLPAASQNGHIAYYDPQLSKVTELEQINSASCFCKVKEYVYYFSFTELRFYRVNTKLKEITVFPVDEMIYSACAVGDKIFLMTYLTGKLCVFDTVSLSIETIDLSIEHIPLPVFDYSEILKENKKYNQFAIESGFLNLASLLEIDTERDALQLSEKGDAGKNIYDYAKGLVL